MATASVLPGAASSTASSWVTPPPWAPTWAEDTSSTAPTVSSSPAITDSSCVSVTITVGSELPAGNDSDSRSAAVIASGSERKLLGGGRPSEGPRRPASSIASPPTATRSVGRPHDGRRTQVCVTPSGRQEVVGQLMPMFTELAELDESLTAPERKAVDRYLQGAIRALQPAAVTEAR